MTFNTKVLAAVLLVFSMVAPQAWSQALPSKEMQREDSRPNDLVGTTIEDCDYCASAIKRTDHNSPTKEVIAGQYVRDLGGAIPEAPSGATGAVREDQKGN